jgi:serine/threonine protein phosphatase 1
MALMLSRETHVLARAAEAGVEIVAIGDIHGRADLIDALLEAAAREPKRAARRALVLTGDLFDRGPDNLATLELAREAPARIGSDALLPLIGNHEVMMRLSLDPEIPFNVGLDAFGTWLRNGGREVLDEFSPLAPGEALLPEEWLERARAAAPPHVIDWLRGLLPNWRSGGLLFVHAGVYPKADLESFLAKPWNIPLRSLDEGRHWSWVRTPFLSHKPGLGGFSGYFVVHGHTPLDAGHAPRHAEQVARFRLNLDGGSGFTGKAKMAIIRGTSAEVVTVFGPTNAELQGSQGTNR